MLGLVFFLDEERVCAAVLSLWFCNATFFFFSLFVLLSTIN